VNGVRGERPVEAEDLPETLRVPVLEIACQKIAKNLPKFFQKMNI
jgi:hypothetical protein